MAIPVWAEDQDADGVATILNLPDGSDPQHPATVSQLEAAVAAVELLPGPGVAVGGTTGQVLSKVDGTDFNTEWIDLPTGGGEVYAEQNIERTGSYVYVGVEAPSGAWKVYRRTLAAGLREFATGGSGYGTAWSGRAGLPYA